MVGRGSGKMAAMRFRRYFVSAVVLALTAMSFITLARGVDAETANATWSCGSVLNPKSMGPGLAGAEQPPDAQMFFIAGEAACASRRDEAVADSLKYLLPVLGLALVVALNGSTQERFETPHAQDTTKA